jgi:NAD+ kinase
MPKNLVIVRHGQSQRNLAGQHAWERGDLSLFSDIITRPSSLSPLTPLGKEEAACAGKWLKMDMEESSFLREGFARHYVSSFIRARQTAGLLDLPDAQWYVDNNIRERNSGIMEDMTPAQRAKYLEGVGNRGHILDPFNFRPLNGESFADVTIRLQFFFGTLHRECSKGNVLVVNHGDVMWALRFLLERWTPEDFNKVRMDKSQSIPNCLIVHYTRVDPYTRKETEHLNWVRTICPWEALSPTPWRTITRRRYTSVELLQQVANRLTELT